MPRQPQLEPRWLIGLLMAWARRVRREEIGSLGYPSISPMLRDGIPSRTTSYEPTGYASSDLDCLTAALAALDPAPRAAVIRYCLPERAAALNLEWRYSADSWLRHLRSGLASLEAALRLPGLHDAENTATMPRM